MPSTGHTIGMKTAVSVPDKIFKEAEHYARLMGKSRSALYSEALTEYLASHSPDSVTDALNEVCRELDTPQNEFSRTASRRILARMPW